MADPLHLYYAPDLASNLFQFFEDSQQILDKFNLIVKITYNGRKQEFSTDLSGFLTNEWMSIGFMFIDCILHSRVDGKKQFIFGIWHWTVPSSWSILKGW